jgi:hypothetical protein
VRSNDMLEQPRARSVARELCVASARIEIMNDGILNEV